MPHTRSTDDNLVDCYMLVVFADQLAKALLRSHGVFVPPVVCAEAVFEVCANFDVEPLEKQTEKNQAQA